MLGKTNTYFFETSAKNSTNIKEIFRSIAQEVPHRKPPKSQQRVVLEDDKNETKDKCKC